MQSRRRAMVLLSGGIDSAACIHYYDSLDYDVEALHVDYGQSACAMELQSARQIADYYEIELRSTSFDSSSNYGPGMVSGRNAFLIFSALLSNPDYRGIISMGLHSGTPYYDCSERFAGMMKLLVSDYTIGQVSLDFPFLRWTKPMIFNYCARSGVPVSLCYSCEKGDAIPCGLCSSCKDVEALHAQSGDDRKTQWP